MATIQIKKYKCPHCGKMVDVSENNFPGKPCMSCHQSIMRILKEMRGLLQEEVAIERQDQNIAAQVNAALQNESAGISPRDKKVIEYALRQMITDEKRRKRILKHILSLDKKS